MSFESFKSKDLTIHLVSPMVSLLDSQWQGCKPMLSFIPGREVQLSRVAGWRFCHQSVLYWTSAQFTEPWSLVQMYYILIGISCSKEFVSAFHSESAPKYLLKILKPPPMKAVVSPPFLISGVTVDITRVCQPGCINYHGKSGQIASLWHQSWNDWSFHQWGSAGGICMYGWAGWVL